MTLEKVKKDILQQAEKEASKIDASAKKEAAEILKKSKNEVKSYKVDAEKNHQNLVSVMERKVLSTAKADAQKLVYDAKEKAFQEVMNTVELELVSMEESERKKFLESLLSKAQSTIDVGAVLVSKQDVALIPLTENIKILAFDISGGLIAETKDGEISVDLSIKEQLEIVQAEKLVEINEVLLGK
tara:strand:- start:588 stop:1145 length:558 start_codon:yes stop_codon:yes gene_type:complete